MKKYKSVKEVLNESYIELTQHVVHDLKHTNEQYQKLAKRKKELVERYPKIIEIEYTHHDIYLNKEEVEAMFEYQSLQESQRIMEEEEIYYKGMKDCFEYMVNILKLDIHKDNFY